MTQTRRESLIEAITNVVVGYVINLGAQVIMFKSLGMSVALSTNCAIGAAFTIISLVRSYCLRRFFNLLHKVRQ